MTPEGPPAGDRRGGERGRTASPSGDRGAVSLRSLTPILLRSLANRLRRFARRLRDPRYAAAFLVGLAYFGWLFGAQGGGAGGPEELGAVLGGLRGVAPFLVAVLAGFWWVRGGYERALEFSPAEVHFLFPAPIRRRTLLHFKLLRLQGGLLLTASVLSLLPRSGLPWPARFLSWWLLATTLHLHQLGASLSRTAGRSGRARSRHGWIPLVLVAMAAGGLAVTLWLALPGIREAGSVDGVLGAMSEALRHPLPRAILFPVELILAPIFAPDAGAWLSRVPGAAAVLLVHYLWVTGTAVPFREAAARAGEAEAERKSAPVAGRAKVLAARGPGESRSSPFPLAPTGEPAVALLWKNVTAFVREFRRATLVVMAGAVAVVFCSVLVLTGSWRVAVTATCAVLAGLSAGLSVLGPLGFRYDLRRDLERIEWLRTFPIRGDRIVAAEIGAATLCLTGLQAVLLLAAGALLPFGTLDPGRLPLFYGGGLAALVVFVPLNVVALAIQNGLALLFPDWIRIGRERPGGVDHVGQSILTLSAALLLLALLLAPALGAAAATALALSSLPGPAGLVGGGLVGMAVLSGEAVLLVRWLGRRLDALEPDAHGLLRR